MNAGFIFEDDFFSFIKAISQSFMIRRWKVKVYQTNIHHHDHGRGEVILNIPVQ